MPFGMLKDYIADMGDVVDYRPMDNLKYSEMNMFGFKDGVAGKDMQSIGFDKIAHDVAKKKRVLSSVISISEKRFCCHNLLIELLISLLGIVIF